MISLLSIIVLGFFLGMRHATDPDHVIAVTTIVSRHRKLSHAALIGAFWGVGHTLTILIVGGGIVLFGWVIPPRLGLSMEFSVGLMLILLGVLNLTGILQWITATLPASLQATADFQPHSHIHGTHAHASMTAVDAEADASAAPQSPLGWLDRHLGQLGLYQAVRPLAVGLVHGLAGSAAVALLVLATIRNPKWAMLYLLIFGVGTIAGMMVITGALVVPFVYAQGRFSRLNRGLGLASGLISVGFGLFILYHIGFVNGLFTAHPQWTPH